MTKPLPDPAALSDDGLAVVADSVARIRDAYHAVDAQAPTDASAWLAAAGDALAEHLAPELRRRINARVDDGLAELLGDEGP